MELAITAALFVLFLGLFIFARWKARQPAEPLKVRWINYTIVQYGAAVVMLLMVAHLLTLMTGRTFKGRMGEAGPPAIVRLA